MVSAVGISMPLSPLLRVEDFAGIFDLTCQRLTERLSRTAFQSEIRNRQSAIQVPYRAFLFFLRLHQFCLEHSFRVCIRVAMPIGAFLFSTEADARKQKMALSDVAMPIGAFLFSTAHY
jgi:hypothetical protein